MTWPLLTAAAAVPMRRLHTAATPALVAAAPASALPAYAQATEPRLSSLSSRAKKGGFAEDV